MKKNVTVFKKLILLCLLVLVTVFVVACGGGNDDNKKKKSSSLNPPPTTTPPPITPTNNPPTNNPPTNAFRFIIHNGVNEEFNYCAVNLDDGNIVDYFVFQTGYTILQDVVSIAPGADFPLDADEAKFKAVKPGTTVTFDSDCIGVNGKHYYSKTVSTALQNGKQVELNTNEVRVQAPNRVDGQVCVTPDDKGNPANSVWYFNVCDYAGAGNFSFIIENSASESIKECSLNGASQPAVDRLGRPSPLKQGHLFVITAEIVKDLHLQDGASLTIDLSCTGVSGKTYKSPQVTTTVKSGAGVSFDIK